MNIWEYNKVKDFSYEDYCAYLSSKYFNQSKDGLFKHHTKENLVANLCDPDVQKHVPLEFRDDITYCSFDEHLLLHILIGEQTDVRKALGLGGAVNYIIPQLKNYFDFGICDYPEKYYSNLSIEVFNALLVRCEKVLNDRTIIFEHNKCLYLQMEWLLNNKNKALVVLGTCLGKTTTALEYLWRHKCRALVIAPNNTIVKGWSEYASWCDVTTYQSFSNTYQCIDYSKYGLVIIKEICIMAYDSIKRGDPTNEQIFYYKEHGINFPQVSNNRKEPVLKNHTVFINKEALIIDDNRKGIIKRREDDTYAILMNDNNCIEYYNRNEFDFI